MSVSVVIPSFRDPEGAYLTALSAAEQLVNRHGSELILVNDGGSPIPLKPVAQSFKIIEGDFGSPQSARDAGIRAAKNDHVFCLDSHVITPLFFWDRLLDTMADTRASIVFAPYAATSLANMNYGFHIDWNGNLWNAGNIKYGKSWKPYEIAVAGHGGMLIRKTDYVQSGGYLLSQKGYGGEEVHLCLKFWHLGMHCVMEPRTHYWHYTDPAREGDRQQTKEFADSLVQTAFVVGGDERARRVETYFAVRKMDTRVALLSTLEDDRKRVCEGNYDGDLDKLRKYFDEKGIPN